MDCRGATPFTYGFDSCKSVRVLRGHFQRLRKQPPAHLGGNHPDTRLSVFCPSRVRGTPLPWSSLRIGLADCACPEQLPVGVSGVLGDHESSFQGDFMIGLVVNPFHLPPVSCVAF